MGGWEHACCVGGRAPNPLGREESALNSREGNLLAAAMPQLLAKGLACLWPSC